MLHLSNKHTQDDLVMAMGKAPDLSVDMNRLQAAYADCCRLQQAYLNEASIMFFILSEGRYYDAIPDDIIAFLLSKGVSEHFFKVRNVKGYSFDMTKVVQPLLDKNIYPEILEPYVTSRSYLTKGNFLRKMIPRGVPNSYKGIPIFTYSYEVEPRSNLRVYYRDLSITQIPKEYSNMITVSQPGEEFLISFDCPQMDFRMAYNLFLRSPENDAVFANSQDNYESLARLVEGEEFDPKVFKEKRSEYKLFALKVFYNSGDTSSIAPKLREFYMRHPKYKKYYENLELLSNLNIPVNCTSYFGYTQPIPANNRKDFLSKGLNTPMQTMTSHVVIESLFGILEKFYNLGYTEDDISLYFSRHDELVFRAKRSILKDLWVLGDCSSIYVDGFNPIPLEFHLGYYYSEDDDELMALFRQSCAENVHRYTKVAPADKKAAIDYNPLASVVHISFLDNFYFNHETHEIKIAKDLPEAIAQLNSPTYLFVEGKSAEAPTFKLGSTIVHILSNTIGAEAYKSITEERVSNHG